MPDIHLDGVTKNYGAGPDAVDRLELTVEDGDFMCLLGPSGCGKTTTVRMIAGLENITAGKLSIGDTVVDDPASNRFVSPEQREIGLVFQSYALWPHLSVEDNIDYGLKLRKLSKPQRRESVDSMLAKLGIEKYAKRYPSQLSGGQQQRVALARMLAVEPKLMLMDEPLSNLDSRLRLEMRAELKRIHEEFNATVVFVTHDQWEAMTLATRVAVMNEGVLQQVGTPMDIYDRPVNRFVANFLGVPPMNFVEMDHDGTASRTMSAFLTTRLDRVGDVGSVGIRPESLRVEPQADSDGAAAPDELVIPAVVDSVMPTGGSWTVEASVDDSKIYTTTLQRGRLHPGDQVNLIAAAADLHVFDQGEHRINLRTSEEQHGHRS